MRRIRNLALFGLASFAILVAVAWIFRTQLSPFLGISLDSGPGGRADLSVPEGYSATVFADGLARPRFMAVSPDGVLFVAERGADRVVAIPDTDNDGIADGIATVGIGYGNAHDIEFDADGSLLVAGDDALYARMDHLQARRGFAYRHPASRATMGS